MVDFDPDALAEIEAPQVKERAPRKSLKEFRNATHDAAIAADHKTETSDLEYFLDGALYEQHVSFHYGLRAEKRNYDLEAEINLLSGWIASHVFLQSLDFRGCRFSGQALRVLGPALARNRSINVLNFTYNELGAAASDDADFFLAQLAENVSIWKLELGRNMLWDPTPIADFLKENVGVTHLSLMHNPDVGASEGAAQEIVDAMTENGSVYQLRVAGSGFGEAAIVELGRLCRRNRAAVAYKMEQKVVDFYCPPRGGSYFSSSRGIMMRSRSRSIWLSSFQHHRGGEEDLLPIVRMM